MSAKQSKSGACKPRGPWCIGMASAIAAEDGIAESLSMTPTKIKGKSTMAARTVLTHTAVINGERTKLVLSYCPWCRSSVQS